MSEEKKIETRLKTGLNNNFVLVSKCLLNVMLFSGIPVTALIPLFFKWYSKINDYYATYYWPQVIMFMISGIFSCLIVYELRKMIRTVEEDNCFIIGNVKSLRKMGGYSFVIAGVSCCRLALYATPAVLVVIIVFVIAGLFSKVLAGVFDRAVAYKEENELTI